jgi:ABC-type glutathione transport system ATPase component
MSFISVFLIFSGGTKRKVSAALAFMANPTLIFLDEPTTVRIPTSKIA